MKHRNQPLIFLAVASLLVLGAIFLLLQRPARRWLGFQTPTPLPSQTLTASPTPWVVTQEITATPMPTAVLAQVELTPTAAKPVSTKAPAPRATEPDAFEYTENCVTIEEGLPEDVEPADELILYDWELGRNRVYDFSVGYDRRSPFVIPFWGDDDFVPSPDGKWMAYTVKTYNEKGVGAKSRTLEVQNVEGRKLDMADWQVDWQYILGWTDDQRLILYVPTYASPAGSVVLLNPFTTEWEVFSPSLPTRVEVKGSDPDFFEYNPSMTQVVYSSAATLDSRFRYVINWRLIDLSSQQVLWTGIGSYGFFSKWSPNGKRFVFVDVIQDDYDNVLVIEQDGKVRVIRNNVESIDERDLSWSPDGRYLATWMDKEGIRFTLANIEDQTLTNLCISPAKDYWAAEPIYWSPDGRFVAFQIEVEGTSYWGGYDTILVDVERQRAFRFREHAAPMGWMKKP